MKSDTELEQLLRKAPSPAAPVGLEQRLIHQASRPRREERPAWTWFSIFKERNWAPALALFIVLAGLLTAVAVQQNSLNDLQQKQEELAAQLSPPGAQSQEQSQNLFSPLDREYRELEKQSAELQSLRAEMAEIERLLAQQPQLTAQNAALRAELSSLTKSNPEASPEFQAALAEARKKTDRIKCVNNLKNVGLGARIWAADNGDNQHLPMDFVTMKNELGTPKVLICPSDSARSAERLNSWEQFAALGGSYEILSPGISEQMPEAVYARCPFHNNVARADGSVMQLRPDQQLVQRDGHWEVKK